MNLNNDSAATLDPDKGLAWYRGLSGYHWFVLIVCWMAWVFDTFDQQLFVLCRKTAVSNLLQSVTAGMSAKVAGDTVTSYAGFITMIMMFGWATGGIIFGILGDKWGRAKTMILAIMFYSIFTGLSSFSVTWIDFTLYRFLTGLGVGGTFGAAVSFVAEVLPNRSRPFALGALQALAAVGNMTAAALSMAIKPAVQIMGVQGWRVLFMVGIIPAILALLVMRKIKEPESWVQAKKAQANGTSKDGKKMGSMRELFGDPRWRKNVIIGIIIGLAGIIGLWGIGFWQPELVSEVVKSGTAEQNANQGYYSGLSMFLFNGAAAIGTYIFAALMARIGRRASFAGIFVLAIVAVFVVFGFMSRPDQIWWMAPLLGLGTLTIFGGFSIYFPELFPTRLRATGVGFCYNTARYLAAFGPLTLGTLSVWYGGKNIKILSSMGGVDSGFRYAAMTVAVVFAVGLVALLWAPETKGKPLPE
jgi:MFS family permease